MARKYDLVVVGNGAAGDGIARTLGRKGLSVAVVEASHLGGECLNDGCVPSKSLIDIARRANGSVPRWSDIVAQIHSVQLEVRGNDPDGGMKGDGIDLFWGKAEFSGPTSISVSGEEIEGENVVLATGTAPSVPPIPGLSGAAPLTNRDIFRIPALPKSLAVVGAGPIGLELGQSFSRLGSDVVVFEAMDRIAVSEEPEVSAELTKLLERDGLRIVTGARIEKVSRDDAGVTVATADGEFKFEEILVAAGRSAQVPSGLDELGLDRDRRGFIAIKDCGQTNLPGLWAAGDVTGRFQFTHYAGYQADHIARHIDEDRCDPVPDTLVPWAIFTEPEVGHAGMTEQQARENGHSIRVATLKAAELDWFRTTGQPEGFVKVVADSKSGQLLGVHFVCARGSTLVGEAALAIQNGLTATQVADTIHPYPTASELLRWACSQLK